MNIFELTWFTLMFFMGGYLAKVLYVLGGFWLGLVGFGAGFGAIPACWFAYSKYRKWAYLGDKWMPECACGSAKFSYVRVGGQLHLLCQACRTRYEKRRGEVSVYEDGVKKPYKRLVKRRGWV